LSTQNENHDDYYNSASKEAKEDSKAVKAMEELQKEQRDSEQLDVNPDQVLEEKEKRQPYSTEKE
jgi:predicted ribosome quality control (RQC) complex YloA/Tae2 family protein